jgi:hypothetical protein
MPPELAPGRVEQGCEEDAERRQVFASATIK